ncbi:MAG: mechanosensitive ion channel family protein [Desulfobacterales bacterium]|nr:mechanosensitive ion channel family protein [Desulfobacterales bacterium]
MIDFSVLLDQYQVFSENILLKRVVVVAVYAALAKAADLLIDRVFRQLAARTELTFDDDLIAILHAPICSTVFLLGVLHALVLQPLQPPWQLVLPRVVQSSILLFWLVATFRFLNTAAERSLALALTRGKVGKDLFQLLKNVARVVVIIAGLLWLLAIWDVDLTPLFASAGIAGIAVALAAKDTLANFFGGISLFMDNTFKVGDYIILDSGERGEVVELGIRSTRVKTRDDVLITVPNSILANSKIINESAPIPRFRIRVPVGVAYGSDLNRVEQVLLDVVRANPNVSPEPAPRVRVRTFADSSVNFELLCWVDDPSLKGLETHNLLKAAYQAFDERNIVIPFPQRDIHIIGSGNQLE